MPRALLAVVALILVSAASVRENSATIPAPRDSGAWARVHEMYVRRGEKEPADLVFLGDSITQGWHGGGRETWERYYAPRRVSNLGIGGDRTENVLYRLDNGEVDKVRPRVVVLMIGTNNLGRNTPEEIADGVKAVVGRLRSKLPESKILLLAVFPRGLGADKDAAEAKVDPRIAAINAGIANLDDGKRIKSLDIGKIFLDDSGMIPASLMPDFLHLTPKGYRLWAEAMEPILWEMMESK